MSAYGETAPTDRPTDTGRRWWRRTRKRSRPGRCPRARWRTVGAPFQSSAAQSRRRSSKVEWHSHWPAYCAKLPGSENPCGTAAGPMHLPGRLAISGRAHLTDMVPQNSLSQCCGDFLVLDQQNVRSLRPSFIAPSARGMRLKTWTGYAKSPKLLLYSRGLRAPKDILIRFSLYQRM
jgi:hypothetical protein